MKRLENKIRRLVEELEKEVPRARCHEAWAEEAQGHLEVLERSLRARAGSDEPDHGESLLTLRNLLERFGEECGGRWQARLDAVSAVAQELHGEMQSSAELVRLGELSATVAHEIRNHVCGVLFSLEVLESKMDPDDSRNAVLRNVRAEAEKMEKIVENLLHFARRYVPQLVLCDLETAVRRSIDSVRSHLGKKEIVTDLKLSLKCDELEMDHRLMQSVFRNILLNAADASPTGGRIEIELFDIGRDSVAAAFKDHGEGIGPERIEKIFEPFHTSKAKGTGLGLAVSKKIVDAHNGVIEVASEPGKGSTFTVKLPRKQMGGQRQCELC